MRIICGIAVRYLTSAGQRHASAVHPWEKDPVSHEAGWGSGPAWMGTESVERTGTLSPNLPAHGESLLSKRTAGTDHGLSLNCIYDSFNNIHCSFTPI